MLRRLPGRWTLSGTRGSSRVYEVIEADAAGREHVLYVDGEEAYRSSSFEELLIRYEAGARFFVAETSPQRAFVHAGAVAWKGRAIVIPAGSAHGKTTLTAALVRQGARYLSDEFALVDDRGRIHPFAKPLSLTTQNGQPRFLPVEAIGGVQGLRPVPPGLVVFTAYGATKWHPRTLTPGEGMLQLLRHTVSTRLHPGPTLARLERLVTSAVMLKGRRGEADATAPLILERLERAIAEGGPAA